MSGENIKGEELVIEEVGERPWAKLRAAIKKHWLTWHMEALAFHMVFPITRPVFQNLYAETKEWWTK